MRQFWKKSYEGFKWRSAKRTGKGLYFEDELTDIYGPSYTTADYIFPEEDILFAKGPEDGEKHLINLATGKTKEI